jgi:AhpD family alkylhydroperoxidase
MAELNITEHELVALDAAIASNCVPCAEFRIAEARRLGLTDSQIAEAVQVADKVRPFPPGKSSGWPCAVRPRRRRGVVRGGSRDG